MQNNGYKTKEEAAFNTLGILRPIFLNNDDNNNCHGDADAGEGGAAGDLARPVLLDNGGTEDLASVSLMAGSAFAGTGVGAVNMTASLHNNNAFFASATSPGRGNCPDEESLGGGPRTQTRYVSVKGKTSLGKIKHVAHVSRFGNEVDHGVLEALHGHNMMANNAGLNAAASLEMASNSSVTIDCDRGSSEPNAVVAPTRRDPGSLPPKVISLPGLSRVVSALSTVEFEHSPRPSMNSCQRGKSIFEDSVWMLEYNAKGCIDDVAQRVRSKNAGGCMGDRFQC